MATEQTENDSDYLDHKATYSGICGLMKYSIVAIVITLLLLAWLVV